MQNLCNFLGTFKYSYLFQILLDQCVVVRYIIIMRYALYSAIFIIIGLMVDDLKLFDIGIKAYRNTHAQKFYIISLGNKKITDWIKVIWRLKLKMDVCVWYSTNYKLQLKLKRMLQTKRLYLLEVLSVRL